MDLRFWQNFRDSEDGAVTVDWVVLTAGLLIFGVMTANLIITGSTATSTSVGAALSNAEVPAITF